MGVRAEGCRARLEVSWLWGWLCIHVKISNSVELCPLSEGHAMVYAVDCN